MMMASMKLMYDLKYEKISPHPPCSRASGAKVSRASVSDLQQKTIHIVSKNYHILYHPSISNKVFYHPSIINVATRSLWLCLSNLLVTAETLITVTGSSVTFDKIFRHRTLQMLILLNRNTVSGKTPNARSFLVRFPNLTRSFLTVV